MSQTNQANNATASDPSISMSQVGQATNDGGGGRIVSEQIVELQAQLQGIQDKKARETQRMTIWCVTAGALLGGAIALGIIGTDGWSWIGQFAAVAGFITVAITVLLWWLRRTAHNSDARDLQGQLNKLWRLADTESALGKTYFDELVRINVTNLDQYYILIKTQTNKSFLASISAGLVGFVLIVLGLLASYLSPTENPPITYIATASGLITEFIGGIFFYLYNKTVLELRTYHKRLLDVQNVLLSLKLVNDTETSQEKMKMITDMVSYLIRQHIQEADDTTTQGTRKRASAERRGDEIP